MLTQEEMRDLAYFVRAAEFLKGEGEPTRGRQKFEAKGSAPSMVSALWQHRSLLDGIQKKEVKWPHFAPTDFDDICAYLDSAKPKVHTGGGEGNPTSR